MMTAMRTIALLVALAAPVMFAAQEAQPQAKPGGCPSASSVQQEPRQCRVLELGRQELRGIYGRRESLAVLFM